MAARAKNHLTPAGGRSTLAALKKSVIPLFFMSKVCSITGARVSRGHVIHRRGLAKKKGGIGQHVTANTPRTFTPNLKVRRLWVPELSKFVKVKLTARALKTVAKNGAYRTLKKAGVV